MRPSTSSIFVLMVCCALCSASQDPSDAPPANKAPDLRTPEQARAFVGTFLGTITTGTIYDAFALIKNSTPGADAEIDATRDRTQQLLDSLRNDYGKVIGYDFVVQQKLGDSIVREEALLKLEHYAIRCTVYFYKPADRWLPVRVAFDQDVNSLFDQLYGPKAPAAAPAER